LPVCVGKASTSPKAIVPEPFVISAWPEVPSEVGRVKAVTKL